MNIGREKQLLKNRYQSKKEKFDCGVISKQMLCDCEVLLKSNIEVNVHHQLLSAATKRSCS